MKLLSILRSAVFWLCLSVSLIVYGLFLLCAIPFSNQVQRYGIIKSWCSTAVWLMKTICGVCYEVEGFSNVPPEGPVVFMAKHQSGWETFALTSLIPRRLSYIYKRELHKVPIFGWGLASVGMISIDRESGRHAFELLASEVPKFFARGWAIIIFPEGTRTAPGQTVKYKSGGARIAVDTGAPVIPIALNSGECWPKHSFVINPGLIRVVIGSSIESSGKDAAALNADVQSAIEAEMARISPRYYKKALQ